MKTGKKVALTLLSAAMLVTASVMGTLAYLQDSETVTNTFTVGNVAITLDEAPVNADGALTSGDRTTSGNSYKLLPGHEYYKDPTVGVAAGSENAWLFVKVEGKVLEIEAPDTDEYDTIAEQMAENGWVEVADGIYGYEEAPVAAGNKKVVFTGFTVKGDISNEELAEYATAENAANSIKITAYGIQADGFDTAAEAWTTAGSDFTA